MVWRSKCEVVRSKSEMVYVEEVVGVWVWRSECEMVRSKCEMVWSKCEVVCVEEGGGV